MEDLKIDFSKTISVLAPFAKLLCAPWVGVFQFKDRSPRAGLLKVHAQHHPTTC